ncbi:MAG: class I SAM-dependent methyltransferase, partial [Christiangramia sp.]|nr:class I SAM-dependent methyltransferase [Christiangramia sp.]
LTILKESVKTFDWVYADPARRDDRGGKVFRFEDCEPNIPANLEMIFEHTDNIMVKSSPILDITAGMNELGNVKEVHVVAVKNEVKELLWILQKNFQDEPKIKTINFEKEQVQEFADDREFASENASISLPEKYLYEPNSAIMKSGLFDILAVKTGTQKLHQHSHLYTSKELLSFPGRIFKITDIKEYKPSYLKKYFKSKKANITTRNFPETVDNIRKKFKIKEGGSDYLFFTTNMNDEKIVIFCKKV